jgi:hypothetical protein
MLIILKTIKYAAEDSSTYRGWLYLVENIKKSEYKSSPCYPQGTLKHINISPIFNKGSYISLKIF